MQKTKISAEIIADSKNVVTGDRITSFVIVIPRIVLAEFNTHRMISRNSASSRAIPFEKMLERVKSEPFIPMKFQKDHSGMQGTEYFTDKEIDDQGIDLQWLQARDNAIEMAKALSYEGVTKQLCNRLLEPFMYHTIICTATEWENFFALRHHPAAEIHIAKVAELMLEAMNNSTPKDLQPGEWHIPFGDKMEDERIVELFRPDFSDEEAVKALKESQDGRAVMKTVTAEEIQMAKIKIATARCARVSYLNYEGGDDYEKDIALHDRLSSMGHWSPFEHCAQAMNKDQLKPYQVIFNKPISSHLVAEFKEQWQKAMQDPDKSILINGDDIDVIPMNGRSGNFKGFIQYRKTFINENKSEERLIKK